MAARGYGYTIQTLPKIYQSRQTKLCQKVWLSYLLAMLFIDYYLVLDVGFVCVHACTKFMNVVLKIIIS